MKDEEVLAKLREICRDEDPTEIYTNMVKIGQGYVTIVLVAQMFGLVTGFIHFQCVRWGIHCLSTQQHNTCRNQANESAKAAKKGTDHQRNFDHEGFSTPQHCKLYRLVLVAR